MKNLSYSIVFLFSMIAWIPAYAEQEAIFSQYVISGVPQIAPLQEKAVEALQDAANDENIELLEQSGPVTLVGHPESDTKDAPTIPERHASACKELRKQTRELLRSNIYGGETNLIRRFNCDPNAELTALHTPNDPLFSSLWGYNQTNDIDMNMPEAWEISRGNPNVVVAVIDTGVKYDHEDLADNMWRNPGEIPGNGLDDDLNGYVDDVYGINSITGSGNPMDDNGHGTHVAGSIAARGNNNTGLAGVCLSLREANTQGGIMAVKFLSGSGSGSLYDAVKSIDYVTLMKQRGVNVILSNNSWGGGGYYSSLYDSINRAKNAGLLFVAAAGNNTNNNDVNPSYPASYGLDNIISVAAVDSNGNLASFSNYGATSVHIAAPGVSISSTYYNGSYTYLSGTSMATPNVSGALALLAGYAPSLTWQQLKTALLTTGRTLSSLSGKTSTGKMVDAYALLTYQLPPGVTPEPTPTITPTRTPTPVPSATPTPTPTATPTPGIYSVSGLVTNSSGLPMSQVQITIEFLDGDTLTTYTGPNGTYRFANLIGSRSFTLSASSAGVSFNNVSSLLNSDQVINFVAVENTYAVGGKVIKADGTPLSGIVVYAGSYGVAISNGNGDFSFNLPYNTDYELTVAGNPGYFPKNTLSGKVLGRVSRTFVRRDD